MLWAGSSLFATVKLTRPACTCWQALSGDGSRVSKIWWSWLVRRNSSRWYMNDGKQWWLALQKPCTTMPHRPGCKLHLLCFLPFLIQHQDHKMSPSQLPLKLRWALIFQECVLSAVWKKPHIFNHLHTKAHKPNRMFFIPFLFPDLSMSLKKCCCTILSTPNICITKRNSLHYWISPSVWRKHFPIT